MSVISSLSLAPPTVSPPPPKLDQTGVSNECVDLPITRWLLDFTFTQE